jgi:hypothetical protein
MLAAAASAALKSRAALHLENLALRHQLGVLRRSVKRPKLTSADRLLWAWLCEVWIARPSALVIVKPETVIGWHRKGFRLFWTWKVRHGQTGRPPVSKEIRAFEDFFTVWNEADQDIPILIEAKNEHARLQ